MNMETFTPEKESTPNWEKEMLSMGGELDYPKEEIKKDIQEVRRLKKEMSKEKGEYKKEKLEKSLALEKFIIEQMNKWDVKYEMEEEDEDIIATTNKFDDYKNGADLYIYDEKKEVMLLIDITTAEQYEKIDKKVDSIIKGIDSKPQDYKKLNYHEKNGNKNNYKKLGHLKYPDPEKLEDTNEKSIKNIPTKNIPRVVVNITRETLKNYKKREKELKRKKDYNQVVSLESFQKENQIKWEVFQQIDKQLLEQSLRLLNQILTFLAEITNSSTNKITLDEKNEINLLNLQKKFVKELDEYKTKTIEFSRQKISDIKKDADNFSKKIIEKMGENENSDKLEILKDKTEKLQTVFKAYEKYNSMYKKVSELKKSILDKDFKKGLDSNWRKFPDINYQRENHLGKNEKYNNGSPIYGNCSLLK